MKTKMLWGVKTREIPADINCLVKYCHVKLIVKLFEVLIIKVLYIINVFFQVLKQTFQALDTQWRRIVKLLNKY